ncbi:MAG: membrane associated rhomboid family serine protease [Candidatus Nitrosomirales archaeon]|jgi:membrane associated rhomboid family serine protease
MFPLYDENPRSTRPYVNYSLIIINFIVFIWEVIVSGFFGNQRATMNMLLEYGFVPARFLDSPLSLDGILPIFSSMFMHGGIMHILGNMLFLWIFGDNIEDRFGHAKYLFSYLLWGIAATMAHAAWALSVGGDQLLIPAVGASGAISGVLGTYLLLFPRARIVTLLFIGFFGMRQRIPVFVYLPVWFIFQLIPATFGAVAGVAYVAHIGGFAAGVLFGLGYRSILKLRRTMILPRETKADYEGKLEDKQLERPQEIKPLRMEGITANDYIELLIEMPGVNERDVELSVQDNIVYVNAVTADGRRKYHGKAIVHAKIASRPDFMHYLNGILRVRFRRI